MGRMLNVSKGTVLATDVRFARTWLSRSRGLLGRRSLPRGEALLIEPSFSIHTAFMRFPIDVVFLNRDLMVVKVAPKIGSFRVAVALGAHSALELAAGVAREARVEAGDQLAMKEESDET